MMGQRRFCVVNDGAKTFFAYQMTGRGLFSEKKFDEAKTFSEKKIDRAGTFSEKKSMGWGLSWKKIDRAKTFSERKDTEQRLNWAEKNPSVRCLF